ncbi:hypothetical protein ABC977_08310 [Thioalkalicoccus limnaeus]|uniref:Uncharacterized protein n=1 Tax=Thioalkalicoccus limnaeus TaxID=120681 RepID=A0ABV4BD80_9GAMM
MRYRIHPLYKKLLLLVIVIGPFFWLVFTEDGQWRTDTVLLSLLGRVELNLALERLHPELTEEALRGLYPDLDLDCGALANPLGNRVCAARIGTFNGIPADRLTLFFDRDRLNAVKVNYRRNYHERLVRSFHRRIGAPQGSDSARDDGEAATHTWRVDHGVVAMRAGQLGREEEAAVLWLSRAAPGLGPAF